MGSLTRWDGDRGGRVRIVRAGSPGAGDAHAVDDRVDEALGRRRIRRELEVEPRLGDLDLETCHCPPSATTSTRAYSVGAGSAATTRVAELGERVGHVVALERAAVVLVDAEVAGLRASCAPRA